MERVYDPYSLSLKGVEEMDNSPSLETEDSTHALLHKDSSQGVRAFHQKHPQNEIFDEITLVLFPHPHGPQVMGHGIVTSVDHFVVH